MPYAKRIARAWSTNRDWIGGMLVVSPIPLTGERTKIADLSKRWQLMFCSEPTPVNIVPLNTN